MEVKDNIQVVVLGMHRSTSSFVSNWLYESGLNLGDSLVEASLHNKKGYFEDAEFVSLNQKILKSIGLDLTGLFKSKVIRDIPNEYIKNLEDLIRFKNDQNPVWGFKDPRTSLLYNKLYEALLSNPILFVSLRGFREVIDSILRREFKHQGGLTKRFLKSPKKTIYYYFVYPNMILNAWINYNSEILGALKNNPKHIVVNHDVLVKNYKQILENLRFFNVHLKEVDPSSIFSKKLINKKPQKMLLSKKLKQKAIQVESELEMYLLV